MRTLRYLFVLTLLLLAAPTWAQGKLDEIKALNQEAVTAFESYSFKKARKRLRRALDIAVDAGMLGEKGIAPTYVLMGVAYVAGSNDLYRGLHYFVKALRLDPETRIPKRLATPQLLKMFKTARQTVKAVGNPPRISVTERRRPRGPRASKVTATGRGLVHTPIDTAKRGYPIPVKASAGIDIQAHRLFLLYRQAGTVKFARLPMKKAKGAWRASIPAAATQGRYVHYYIEALNQRGRLAGSKGSARSPNVVIIK
jgi:tetratricopeptide (TPR) repeat protein